MHIAHSIFEQCKCVCYKGQSSCRSVWVKLITILCFVSLFFTFPLFSPSFLSLFQPWRTNTISLVLWRKRALSSTTSLPCTEASTLFLCRTTTLIDGQYCRQNRPGLSLVRILKRAKKTQFKIICCTQKEPDSGS